MRRVFRDQGGFSLAELLVVTAVLGLVMVAVISIQQKGQESYIYGANRIEAQQNARVALDRMTRELRSALSIVALTSTDVTFVNQENSQVQYQFSGTNLNRISASGTETIIGGVLDVSMTYYKVWDPDDTKRVQTTGPSEVTVILVQLTAKTEDAAAKDSLGDRRVQLESAIRLRNVNAM